MLGKLKMDESPWARQRDIVYGQWSNVAGDQLHAPRCMGARRADRRQQWRRALRAADGDGHGGSIRSGGIHRDGRDQADLRPSCSRRGIGRLRVVADRMAPPGIAQTCATRRYARLEGELSTRRTRPSTEVPVPDYEAAIADRHQGAEDRHHEEYRLTACRRRSQPLWKTGEAWCGKPGRRCRDISCRHTPLRAPAYYIVGAAETSSNLGANDGVSHGLRSQADDIIAMYENTRAERLRQGSEAPHLNRHLRYQRAITTHITAGSRRSHASSSATSRKLRRRYRRILTPRTGGGVRPEAMAARFADRDVPQRVFTDDGQHGRTARHRRAAGITSDALPRPPGHRRPFDEEDLCKVGR